MKSQLRSISVIALSATMSWSVVPAMAETVNWWGWAPSIETGNEYIAEFNKEYPDITVNFRNIPFANYTQALRLGLVSNSGPDVFNLEPGVITGQFSQFAVDLTDDAKAALGDDWRSKLSRIGVESFSVDGELRGLPVQVGAAGELWYNKDLFDKVGVEPPRTMAEWKDVCAAFESADITCFVQGAKDSWVNLDTYIAIAQSVAPGKVIDAINGTVEWTDPDLVEAFAIWKELFTSGIMQPGALGISQYPDARNIWVEGKAAMIMMGTWHANMMSKQYLHDTQTSAGQNPMDFVALPMDFPDVAGKGNNPGLYGGADYGLALSKRAKEPDDAKKFIMFLTTTKAGATAVAENVFPPALQGVPFIVPDYVDEETQAAAVEKVTQDLADMNAPRQIPYPDVKEALGNALSAVAADTQTPEQAAESVETVSANAER